MCQSVQKIMLKCQTGIKWHTALGCWGDGYKWPLYSHGISKATLFWCLHGTLRQSKSAFSFSIYDFQRLIALFKQFPSCIENNYTPRNKTTEENDCGPLDAKIILICFVKFKYQRRGAKKTSTICLSYDLHSNHSCRISFASDISTDLSVFFFLQDVQQLHPTLIKLLYFRRDAKLLPTKASQTASPPRSAHIQPDL